MGTDNAHAYTALRPSPTQMLADQKKFLRAHASPSIRKFARELGVDLSQVQGTGRKRRITQQDVQVFVKQVLVGGFPTLERLQQEQEFRKCLKLISQVWLC
ncbi:MAG: hypothetical protein CM1200mP28_13880 [Deltaproteobacteria bacterium]|nr:MAG: hypothetical protein CM1200mP28_13880 [Deltaproteobacteria bacterium]